MEVGKHCTGSSSSELGKFYNDSSTSDSGSSKVQIKEYLLTQNQLKLMNPRDSTAGRPDPKFTQQEVRHVTSYVGNRPTPVRVGLLEVDEMDTMGGACQKATYHSL